MKRKEWWSCGCDACRVRILGDPRGSGAGTVPKRRDPAGVGCRRGRTLSSSGSDIHC